MVISSFSPGSVSPGAQDFTLTIVGSGFPALSSTSNDQLSVLWGVGTQNEVYLSIDFAKCDAITSSLPCLPLSCKVRELSTFKFRFFI